jgi:predicted O-methyltransferase YrrM
MYYEHEFLRERQRQMQEMAQAQSQARRLVALNRAARRAERARRSLARAHCEAMRLRAELALRLDS